MGTQQVTQQVASLLDVLRGEEPRQRELMERMGLRDRSGFTRNCFNSALGMKAALVVFLRNEAGSALWEGMGYRERGDLFYRDRTLVEMVRAGT